MDVTLEADQIVIRVPFGVLRTAAEMSPVFSHYDEERRDFDVIRVTAEAAWAKAVHEQLCAEDETGATLLHRAFDRAMQIAWESGAEGIEIEIERPSARDILGSS